MWVFSGTIESFLIAFPALFSIVNPIGIALIYYQVTSGRSHGERTALAWRVAAYSLGVMLFHRHARGLILTEQGELLYRTARDMAAKVNTAEALLRANQDKPAGRLKIHATVGFGSTWLTAQMHELLAYLGQKGVVTILTVTQSGMMGAAMQSPVDTTYLADNVILFRYFEAHGRVRRAISVVKKRGGQHEMTIRELRVSKNGISIGEPLVDFQGVLTGVPKFVGAESSLINKAARDE